MDERDTLHLNPGTLEPSARERTAHAYRSGALHPVSTTSEIIEQEGIAFQVRLITTPSKKTEHATASDADPFSPCDPDLFVAPVSPTHIALLNRYPVIEHHLLIVTRMFEPQQAQLTQKDCEALLIALTEIDGLAFFNAGPVAGASQEHKHLQLIPLDQSTGPRLPVEPLLRFARLTGGTGTVPGLRFRHAYAPMDWDWTNPQKDSGASLLACYRELLRAAGLQVDAVTGSRALTAPYNLLMTRRWLLLVPRATECFHGISINALGFAGALLVKDAAQLATLRREGPMTVLRHVALPP